MVLTSNGLNEFYLKLGGALAPIIPTMAGRANNGEETREGRANGTDSVDSGQARGINVSASSVPPRPAIVPTSGDDATVAQLNSLLRGAVSRQNENHVPSGIRLKANILCTSCTIKKCIYKWYKLYF